MYQNILHAHTHIIFGAVGFQLGKFHMTWSHLASKMYCPKGACCVIKAESEIGIHNTTHCIYVNVFYMYSYYIYRYTFLSSYSKVIKTEVVTILLDFPFSYTSIE